MYDYALRFNRFRHAAQIAELRSAVRVRLHLFGERSCDWRCAFFRNSVFVTASHKDVVIVEVNGVTSILNRELIDSARYEFCPDLVKLAPTDAKRYRSLATRSNWD